MPPGSSVVSARASPPSGAIKKICAASSLRSDTNAILLSSGDQRGELSLPELLVNCRVGLLPSAGTRHSSLWYLFLPMFVVVRTNTMSVPSGEICVSPTFCSVSTSSAVIGRFVSVIQASLALLVFVRKFLPLSSDPATRAGLSYNRHTRSQKPAKSEFCLRLPTRAPELLFRHCVVVPSLFLRQSLHSYLLPVDHRSGQPAMRLQCVVGDDPGQREPKPLVET